jgi:Pyridoxamine-phosphate oxidase
MCFHWKSLRRQIRIQGSVTLVDNKTADEYYATRPYESRIGAWASSQSEVMQTREEFEKKIKEFKRKVSRSKQCTKTLLLVWLVIKALQN